MSYDAAGRLIGELLLDGGLHTFSYDRAGNRTAMADPTGITTSTYSPRNETASVVTPDNLEIGYLYDPVGDRQTMINPDDGLFTYDRDRRLTSTALPLLNSLASFEYDGLNCRIVKNVGGTAYHYATMT